MDTHPQQMNPKLKTKSKTFTNGRLDFPENNEMHRYTKIGIGYGSRKGKIVNNQADKANMAEETNDSIV